MQYGIWHAILQRGSAEPQLCSDGIGASCLTASPPCAFRLRPRVPQCQVASARLSKEHVVADDIAIRRIDGATMAAEVAAQIDAIFFEASGRTTFASPEERTAFRERWLGRYLRGDTDVVLI